MRYRIYKPGEYFGDQKRYQIIEQVGRDHRDEMYRVSDTSQGGTLVLKLLPQELIESKDLQFAFLHVLTQNHSFYHDNIVQAISFENITESMYHIPFFTMAAIEGRPLVEVLSDEPGNRFPVERVIGLARQIAQALDYTHNLEMIDVSGNFASGIFHGNLKPHNIFVSDEDHVQITEFCVAEFLRKSLSSTQYRHHRHLLYLSPEQYFNEEWDHRADIFSLGCILFQMLTGNPPDPQHGLCTHPEGGEFEPSPLLSLEQNSVIAKALTIRIEERSSSVLDFVEQLAAAPVTVEKPPVVKKRPVTPTPARGKTSLPLPKIDTRTLAKKTSALLSGRRKAVVTSVMVITVLVIIYLVAMLSRSPESETPVIIETRLVTMTTPTVVEVVTEKVYPVCITTSFQGSPVSGAPVYLDGERLLGQAPLGMENLHPGPHSVHVLDDNKIGFARFEYIGGETVSVDIPLFKDSTIVTITSPTEQATIYVDGDETGQITPATIVLPAGKHTVSLQKTGFLPLTKKVELTPNVYENVPFAKMKREKIRPTSVPVAKKRAPSPVPKQKAPATLKRYRNSFGMSFKRIPAGKFVMGAHQRDTFRQEDETSFSVKISSSYYMMTTEVTQAQWQAVIGNQPSKFSACGGECPVENINWYEVQRFIKALNEKTKTDGYTYRLPTEAEWEYAARARQTGSLSLGDLVSSGCSPLDSVLNRIGWYCGNSDRKTHPVALKKANSFGLYDMSGNVMEWCQDRYGPFPDSQSTIKDYPGPSRGRNRVLRGGSWNSASEECRITNRIKHGPGRDNNEIGFRLVAVPSSK